MYKLIFYVPKDNAEVVKESIFATGAGSIGNYSHCAWETLGTGQFKPLPGANPSIGGINQIEKVIELRVEILCKEDNIKTAIQALKSSHPYEEPAYEIVSIENDKFPSS